MITDTITEEARDQIRQMQGEIERLTKQLVRASEPFGYLLEKAGINNGYYFISPAEYQNMEERFREFLIPVFTKTDEIGT